MVLRPIRAGVCRLGECKNEITLTELLQLNLALDEEDDFKGLGLKNNF